LSRLGYRQLRHELKSGETNVRLALTESAVELDELVVTGTPGATAKRALGNSVDRISARDEVESTSVNEMQQLLNGRVPGLSEMLTSGNVGTGGLTRIRGINSMALTNGPIVYVDGVRVDNSERVGPSIRNGKQVSRINDHNPEDIEH
jgi:outer membrane cobalamin receptor